MKPTCERCGGLARVRILEAYDGGEPIGRSLCLRCADSAYERYLVNRAVIGRARLSLGSVLVFSGAFLALMGMIVDRTGFEGHAGFGWMQQIGVAVGFLLVLVGTLTRVDVIAVTGTILVGTALLADTFGRFGSPGFGWRQQLVIGFACVLVLIGLRFRSARGARPRFGLK